MCHVHCDISLLILLTHRWLHKSLVTEKSVISPSRSYLFKFFLNFWKDLYFLLLIAMIITVSMMIIMITVNIVIALE